MDLIHAMDLINRAFGLDAHTRTFTEKLEMGAKMAYVCFSIMAWSMIISVMFAVYHILRYLAVRADVGAGQEAEALALLPYQLNNLNSRASDGSTPLHRAAKHGNEALALALVRARADKDAKDNEGSTPLHLAAKLGHEALALALVRAGADKDARDNNGHTPLHLAAQHGHEALALALIAGPSFWGRLWAGLHSHYSPGVGSDSFVARVVRSG
jgi:hypothetical protein